MTNKKSSSIDYILEAILFFYVVSFPFWIARAYGKDVSINIATLANSLIQTLVVIVVLVGGLRYLFGGFDYRFKLGLQIMYIVVLVGLGISFNDQAGGLASSEFNLVSLLILTVPLVGGIILCFRVSFSLINPFITTYNKVYQELSAGNIQKRVDENYALEDKIFGEVSGIFNNILDFNETLLSQVNDGNSQIFDATDVLVNNSEELNASVEEVTSTSQAMSSGAASQAELLFDVVNELTKTNEIISSIIQDVQENSLLVNQIALQTNILALNAGIEASRAGDYGRGFAVVAENVRRLSEESKASASSIVDTTSQISTTLLINFEGIKSKIENVASLAEENTAAAEEVAATMEEITASIEETTALAVELRTSADQSQTFVKKYFKTMT